MLEARADLPTHVANAWDDGDSVHLHDVRCSFTYLSQGLGAAGAASTPDPELQASAVLCHINLFTGRMAYEQAPGHVEFPQIDQRRSGRRHRIAFHLEIQAQAGAATVGFNGLQCTDLQSGCQSRWLAPQGVSLEEHGFVPRSNASAEGCGWLIGTGFDADRQASFCSVFEAERLADGPLAMAYLDGPVPACLHGKFVSC